MTTVFPQNFYASPVVVPNSITAPQPVTGATGGGGGGGLTLAEAQQAFTNASADDENISVELLDDGTGALFLQVTSKNEATGAIAVGWYTNANPPVAIAKPANENQWKEPGAGTGATVDLTTLETDVAAIKISVAKNAEYQDSFWAKDLGSGNFQFFIKQKILNEETSAFDITYLEVDGVTPLAPLPALPWIPASAAGGRGGSITTEQRRFEGTGVNANFPDGIEIDRLQLFNTATNPPTLLGVTWLNPITGASWGFIPAAGDIRESTGRVDELLQTLDARLQTIETNIGAIGAAPNEAGSLTAQLRQLIDETQKRYQITHTELEITTDIPALNMIAGNTIDWFTTIDMEADNVIRASLVNQDNPGQAFSTIVNTQAEYAAFIGQPTNWEAGPTETGILTDSRTLLDDIKTQLATAFGAVGDPANIAGAIHAQLTAIHQEIAGIFQVVKREAVYTAIQDNVPAGITDTIQYQLQEWINGDTNLVYRTTWTNLETGVELTPAQVNLIDIPNDFDPNPIAIATSVSYKPNDWIVLPVTEVASGLSRGAIARELVSGDAQANPPIWLNPDTDLPLATAPLRANLVDADAGMPDAAPVRYREIGGTVDIKAYMLMFPNGDGFEVFSNINLTSQLTVGTTAGELDETTLIPYGDWLREKDRESQGLREELPADLATLQATPATAYSHTQLLKALLIALGTDLDNSISYFLAGTTETISGENLIANSTPLLRIDNEENTKWFTDATPRIELATPPTDPILVGGGGSNMPVSMTFTRVNFIPGDAANNNFVIGTSIELSLFARTNTTRFLIDGVEFRRSYPAIDATFIPGRLNDPLAVEITAGSVIYGRRI